MTQTSSHQTLCSETGFDVSQLLWDVFSIANHLTEIRQSLARQMGISGPQWLILTAVSYLDENGGVPVGHVARKLHVMSTFVTTQTKQLEKLGMLNRVVADGDRRRVHLSLTDAAKTKIAALQKERDQVNAAIVEDMSEAEKTMLAELISRMEIAADRANNIMQAQHRSLPEE